MTDLAAKFTALESQMTTQQTEVINALNTIIEALGGAPPTPTVTLADISTQLTALIDGTALIYDANAIFYTSMLSLAGAINTNTDTIITNNSLNAQRMLQAILSTACACDTASPLLPPPLDVTPTSLVDEAKCRRVQFYLSIFGALVNNISNYGGAGAAITSSAITELVIAAAATGGLAGVEGGAILGVPGAVVGAIIGIIGAIAIALGSAYLFSLQTQWGQSPLHDELVAALYAADSADAGSAAFNSVITSSSVLDLEFKALIIALWWSGWSNDLYSTVPVVDDSGFDGTICAPPPSPIDPGENCISLVSTSPITTSDGQTLNAIVWPNFGTNTLPSSVRPPGYPDIVASGAIWYNGSNLNGYWIRGTDGAGGAAAGRMYANAAGTLIYDFTGSYQQITVDTNYVAVIGFSFAVFYLEICAELPE